LESIFASGVKIRVALAAGNRQIAAPKIDMRITIASLLILIAVCLGLFAAAPATLNRSPISGRSERGQNQRAPITFPNTRSPIRHLIVVVGENRSFDNVFGTYVPLAGQKIWNLLSQGIVTNGGIPGPNVALAAQQQATDTTTFQLSPTQTGAYANLPQPNVTLDAAPVGPCILATLIYQTDAFCTDIGLDPTSQGLLQARGSGQPIYDPAHNFFPVPDCRYPSNLTNGPFSIVGASQLNNCGQPFLSDTIANTTYTSNTGDPVHRFYQMWQQADCSIANVTPQNPSGCKLDLFSWVAITVGWGITNPPTTDQDTYQGGVAMGFYNMAQGDFPYFLDLAYNYAISDNYHQPVMGGTGPNSQFLFTGDVYYNTDANGNPAMPAASLIEDPNPRSGTNNFYNNDHFNSTDPGSTGVAFTNCSDNTQAGVQPIMSYLHGLPYPPFNDGNCAQNHWYQLNNDYPYYTTAGTVISNQDVNEFPAGPAFSIGPQTLPTIGDALSGNNVSWRYYGAGFNVASHNPPQNLLYCAICNGMQYATSIMTTSLRQNIVDLAQFYSDVENNQLPSVSFIKPDTLLDSHPGSSTPPLYEAFVRKIVNSIRGNEQLWKDTAILITFDESGGLYDSGYIQPIDFFGDGPRTVLIAVSPFAKQGYVDHTYADHASILKFIEWNWNIPPLSARSRDNLPNPVSSVNTPYFPQNSPAIGDLRSMFNLPQPTPTPRPSPTPRSP
jgi:phospholipase C